MLEIGVVEMDRAHVVPAAREVDDPLGSAALDQGHQFAGQREMAEVVGAQLHLEAIGGVGEGGRHYAGIVDEDVDLVEPLARPRGRGADAFERAEIDRDRIKLRARHRGADRGHGFVKLGLITPRHHHVSALGRHRARGFLPKPRIGPGDEHRLSREVLALQHLVGGTRPSKSAHDRSPMTIVSVHTGIRDRNDRRPGR